MARVRERRSPSFVIPQPPLTQPLTPAAPADAAGRADAPTPDGRVTLDSVKFARAALHFLVARITDLGQTRDALLIAGGLLYALGYLVWSSYAFSRSLGFMPVLQ